MVFRKISHRSCAKHRLVQIGVDLHVRRRRVFAVRRDCKLRYQICLSHLVDAAGYAGVLEVVDQAGVSLQQLVDRGVVVAEIVLFHSCGLG